MHHDTVLTDLINQFTMPDGPNIEEVFVALLYLRR